MYQALLFDLDGTLTASGEGITKSIQYALRKMGYESLAEDLKKLEDTKKEERKYVIKEAEIVVTNYLSKIDNKMPEKRIKRLEKSYKRAKKMSIILGIISVISIICAIAF